MSSLLHETLFLLQDFEKHRCEKNKVTKLQEFDVQMEEEKFQGSSLQEEEKK